ncbi:hypothetical protein JQ625_27230 [Bradyrhizobium diazoefficiens]|nr:hypothetical protein [Bradyrhizobium diazoefficiens]MBR0778542.1 hypothetical protein [Bradyrhizobium diazoefficiens]
MMEPAALAERIRELERWIVENRKLFGHPKEVSTFIIQPGPCDAACKHLWPRVPEGGLFANGDDDATPFYRCTGCRALAYKAMWWATFEPEGAALSELTALRKQRDDMWEKAVGDDAA